MKPVSIMLIAGEASGDLLAAELVQELRRQLPFGVPVSTRDLQPLEASLQPRFFGAGGPRMAAAGVDLALDLTQHSVIGLSDVLKKYFEFRAIFRRLIKLALERCPDVIICVDFSGFNRRFAHAIKTRVRKRRRLFKNWDPKLVQCVSPQVWASREGRAYQMAEDYDLLLSHFPFEKAWYAARVPEFRVEFVGHPLCERYQGLTQSNAGFAGQANSSPVRNGSLVLLLPGSRRKELQRHLPVMLGAWEKLRAARPGLHARMVLPDSGLLAQAKEAAGASAVQIQIGDLPGSLADATIAVASTGTVTVECAFFGVPTVALYKTSWSTYHVGKRIVKVKYLAMPNILADAPLFPEFIQDAATADNIFRTALDLLENQPRRAEIKARLAQVIAGLGGPGATRRSAAAISSLMRFGAG